MIDIMKDKYMTIIIFSNENTLINIFYSILF
jgi:hypothetical protein